MELMGKLASKDTTNIGMLPSASKYVVIKFADKCINNINNKEILNGLKGSTKMQEIQSQLKYQTSIYNVERNSDVDHIGIKKRCNNKQFPSLNVINKKHIHMEAREF